ncbi:MAG: HEAT repeat domain-containing protein [Deltaproteobacteria bacterium]|nr:HEAT repeat domain-containing protein [Deltaproteobacteria bacterium]
MKSTFEKLIAKKDTRGELEFVRELKKNHSHEMISFHYSLLNNRGDIRFYNSIRAGFEEHGEKGADFLIEQLKTEKNESLMADAIMILGLMRKSEVLTYCYEFQKHNNRDLRYKSIIVLGWVGDSNDLVLLEKTLYEESDTELRGYAATAMGQIWFRKSDTKNEILRIFGDALNNIKDREVKLYILSCCQDLMDLKLGIKETRNGMKFSGKYEKIEKKAQLKIEETIKL